MDLFLDPEATKPLAGQLYEQLRHAITAGRLLPGDQLVPSRQLASELGVSGHTVTTAYGRLVAEGYAQGHGGGGSVVATASPAPPEPAVRRLVSVLPPAPVRLPIRSPGGSPGPRAVPG